MNFFKDDENANEDFMFLDDLKWENNSVGLQDSVVYAYEPAGTGIFNASCSQTNRDTLSNGKIERKRQDKSKQTLSANLSLEDLSYDEVKERNRIRAKLTRKRKANFYTDLENKNKQLQYQNAQLTILVEEYKKKEYQWNLGRDVEPNLISQVTQNEDINNKDLSFIDYIER